MIGFVRVRSPVTWSLSFALTGCRCGDREQEEPAACGRRVPRAIPWLRRKALQATWRDAEDDEDDVACKSGTSYRRNREKIQKLENKSRFKFCETKMRAPAAERSSHRRDALVAIRSHRCAEGVERLSVRLIRTVSQCAARHGVRATMKMSANRTATIPSDLFWPAAILVSSSFSLEIRSPPHFHSGAANCATRAVVAERDFRTPELAFVDENKRISKE